MWGLPVVAAVIAVAGAVYSLRDTHSKGSPVAVATIETPPPVPATPSAPQSPVPLAVVAAPPPSTPDSTTVEVQNGVKIVRFNPSAAHGLTEIPVPPTGDTAGLAPAPDPRVSESSPYGPLPRLGIGGMRPADVYGRPAATGTAGPRLALLLTGMGANQLATADAARRLSADASFGFAPDVADPAAQVAETRKAGHEVLLDLSAAATTDGANALNGLHREMAAYPGYAGVLAGPAAAPEGMRDIAARGLLLLGEGAAPSLAADATADAAGNPAAFAAALARLVAVAKDRGTAMGTIAHASAATAQIAAFIGTLDQAGIRLVPVSALSRAGMASAAR